MKYCIFVPPCTLKAILATPSCFHLHIFAWKYLQYVHITFRNRKIYTFYMFWWVMHENNTLGTVWAQIGVSRPLGGSCNTKLVPNGHNCSPHPIHVQLIVFYKFCTTFYSTKRIAYFWGHAWGAISFIDNSYVLKQNICNIIERCSFFHMQQKCSQLEHFYGSYE